MNLAKSMACKKNPHNRVRRNELRSLLINVPAHSTPSMNFGCASHFPAKVARFARCGPGAIVRDNPGGTVEIHKMMLYPPAQDGSNRGAYFLQAKGRLIRRYAGPVRPCTDQFRLPGRVFR